jgi:hypothetical protein
VQLAYTVYQPPSTFQGCISQWGIDSTQAITKTVPAFYANAVAHIMRVGRERLFVVFKGSDATNFMQNVECAHTPQLGEQFGVSGSDVRVHSGFWAGWKALEKEVLTAVLSFAKEVRQKRGGGGATSHLPAAGQQMKVAVCDFQSTATLLLQQPVVYAVFACVHGWPPQS